MRRRSLGRNLPTARRIDTRRADLDALNARPQSGAA